MKEEKEEEEERRRGGEEQLKTRTPHLECGECIKMTRNI